MREGEKDKMKRWEEGEGGISTEGGRSVTKR